MSRRIKHELTYDAPLAAVAAMLVDPVFREQVCDRQHVLRRQVSVTPSGSGTEVVVDQVQAAEGIPSFAKKFVGDEINIVQKEIWTDAERADVFVTIPGKPGDMRGTIRLEERDGRTTETVSLEIKVGLPLVGGKIEGLVGDLLLKALAKENEVGRDYLSR
ncbi:MAG TPA: DUF2505 domain-containing protein [Nocardioides sp.]|uniref:DUF2505 domain-containing protein n=1 Tax=Nocardioides sp. TaxID=35761 RepID=UPI002CA19116|nr:DUF2505 domain-containing protein [Nocardioides sp.]HTW15743.1 DUF2505 domain-containing protein [Nocardioides sp.]